MSTSDIDAVAITENQPDITMASTHGLQLQTLVCLELVPQGILFHQSQDARQYMETELQFSTVMAISSFTE